MKKTTLIAGAMTVAMMTTAAVPMSVSAKAKVTAPAKVSVTSVKRVNNTKSTVTWKKLKKNTSGYAVYVKKGSSSWKETKKVGAKTASITFTTGVNDKYQVKVRAYKKGKKVKKYYNKKTKKFVSKKAYKKLAKKNRTTKKVATVKWGKYSSVKTLNTVFSGQVKTVNASFNKDEDVSLSWNKVGGAKKYEIYRSEGGNYKLVDSVTGTSYVDKYYNPTQEIYYKVRPVNGACTGAYSSVAKLNPLDIITTIETTVPKKVCTFCNEDVTELSESQLQEKHSVYYCSECGRDKTASHNKADIEKHIQEKHGVMAQDANNTAPTVKCDSAKTKEDGTKPVSKEHHHNWKSMGTTTDEKIVGYKEVTEGHDVCQVCGKDFYEWYNEADAYAKEHGLTGFDIYGSKNLAYMKTIYAHDQKHLEEGAWNAGSTRVEFVTVRKPITKKVTVTKYQCDCGKIRTN